MKFKVGEKVRVKENLEANKPYGGVTLTNLWLIIKAKL